MQWSSAQQSQKRDRGPPRPPPRNHHKFRSLQIAQVWPTAVLRSASHLLANHARPRPPFPPQQATTDRVTSERPARRAGSPARLEAPERKRQCSVSAWLAVAGMQACTRTQARASRTSPRARRALARSLLGGDSCAVRRAGGRADRRAAADFFVEAFFLRRRGACGDAERPRLVSRLGGEQARDFEKRYGA